MDLRGVRRLLFLLIAVFAVGTGCTCRGHRMSWQVPPEEMAAFGGPADMQSPGRPGTVAWVLEWNGETRNPSEYGKTTLVCRFHRMTEKARPKLLDRRVAVPLVFAPDELIATDETVVVHSDIDLEDYRRVLERRGPLCLWFLDVQSMPEGVAYWSRFTPSEVRRQPR